MSAELAFNRSQDVDYGVAQEVAPGVRRIVANNPGPYTFLGTNSYMVGSGEVAVIDPGPGRPSASRSDRGRHQGRTPHSYSHHPQPSRPLRRRARTCRRWPAARSPRSGRPARRGARARRGLSYDFVDPDFVPDRKLADGDTVEGQRLRPRRAAYAGPRTGPSLLRSGRQAHRVHRRSRDGMEHHGDRAAGRQSGAVPRLAGTADAAARQDVSARSWRPHPDAAAGGQGLYHAPQMARADHPRLPGRRDLHRAAHRRAGFTARSMPG